MEDLRKLLPSAAEAELAKKIRETLIQFGTDKFPYTSTHKIESIYVDTILKIESEFKYIENSSFFSSMLRRQIYKARDDADFQNELHSIWMRVKP